jgi:hypothetical protein
MGSPQFMTERISGDGWDIGGAVFNFEWRWLPKIESFLIKCYF